jgi:hypothetical protein
MPRAASTANNFVRAAWRRLPNGKPARLDRAVNFAPDRERAASFIDQSTTK